MRKDTEINLVIGCRYRSRCGLVYEIVSQDGKLFLGEHRTRAGEQPEKHIRQWFFPGGSWSVAQRSELDLVAKVAK